MYKTENDIVIDFQDHIHKLRYQVDRMNHIEMDSVLFLNYSKNDIKLFELTKNKTKKILSILKKNNPNLKIKPIEELSFDDANFLIKKYINKEKVK